MKKCVYAPGQIGPYEHAGVSWLGTDCTYCFYCDFQLPRDSRSFTLPESTFSPTWLFSYGAGDPPIVNIPHNTCNCNQGKTYSSKKETTSSQIGSVGEITENTKGDQDVS